MDSDGGVVEISWPADRRRYAKAVREYPLFRTMRRRSRWFLGAGLSVVVVGFVLSSSLVLSVGIGCLVGVTLVYLWFVLIRFVLLRQTIDGTIRWAIGEAGIRVHGHLTTEVPWTEVDWWYIAGDHLIFGVRSHTRKRSKTLLGLGSPIEAYSDAQMARTRSMFEEHAGPEST